MQRKKSEKRNKTVLQIIEIRYLSFCNLFIDHNKSTRNFGKRLNQFELRQQITSFVTCRSPRSIGMSRYRHSSAPLRRSPPSSAMLLSTRGRNDSPEMCVHVTCKIDVIELQLTYICYKGNVKENIVIFGLLGVISIFTRKNFFKKEIQLFGKHTNIGGSKGMNLVF